MSAERSLPEVTKSAFSLRKSKQSSQILTKTHLEFYGLLANYARVHQMRLNVPETIVYGYSIPRPTLLKTTGDGTLLVRENLGSPE